MFITDKSGAQWQLDNGLKTMAQQLIMKDPDNLGHIDLQHVVFLRLLGSKAKWLGKTWLLKAPHTILTKYAMQVMQTAHVVNNEKLQNEMPYEMHALDVKYIIVINEDAIAKTGAFLEKIEYITLHHELMHISPDMEGINQHDAIDFKAIIDKYGAHWDEGVFTEPNLSFEDTIVSPALPPVPSFDEVVD